jgi:hypothetical protein
MDNSIILFDRTSCKASIYCMIGSFTMVVGAIHSTGSLVCQILKVLTQRNAGVPTYSIAIGLGGCVHQKKRHLAFADFREGHRTRYPRCNESGLDARIQDAGYKVQGTTNYLGVKERCMVKLLLSEEERVQDRRGVTISPSRIINNNNSSRNLTLDLKSAPHAPYAPHNCFDSALDPELTRSSFGINHSSAQKP